VSQEYLIYGVGGPTNCTMVFQGLQPETAGNVKCGNLALIGQMASEATSRSRPEEVFLLPHRFLREARASLAFEADDARPNLRVERVEVRLMEGVRFFARLRTNALPRTSLGATGSLNTR
jgi:hypothetical protein